MAAPNPTRQRSERQRLEGLFARPEAAYVVHYACQSFFRPQQGSPRVASIALRNLGNGATDSFSIHRELEIFAKGHQPTLDDLERSMLEKYFQFIAAHKGMTFVHWNMRDMTFGFAALEHRYEVLGGNPYVLPNHNKIDLAIVITNIYGTDYLPRPHFESVAKRNNLSLAGYIPGGEEPDAFSNGEYFQVLQSTLCKVALIGEVARLAFDRTLKTNATLWTLNVGRFREACELFDRNPVQAWASALFAIASASFAVFMKIF